MDCGAILMPLPPQGLSFSLGASQSEVQTNRPVWKIAVKGIKLAHRPVYSFRYIRWLREIRRKANIVLHLKTDSSRAQLWLS